MGQSSMKQRSDDEAEQSSMKRRSDDESEMKQRPNIGGGGTEGSALIAVLFVLSLILIGVLVAACVWYFS